MSELDTLSGDNSRVYTPTTEEVRGAYEGQLIKVGNNAYQLLDEAHAKSEFDRWLAEVKAEAWEEGWSTGRDVWTDRQATAEDMNPYRQGEGSGNGASQSPVESSNLLNGEEQ